MEWRWLADATDNVDGMAGRVEWRLEDVAGTADRVNLCLVCNFPFQSIQCPQIHHPCLTLQSWDVAPLMAP
jgi:hypothetical protein